MAITRVWRNELMKEFRICSSGCRSVYIDGPVTQMFNTVLLTAN